MAAMVLRGQDFVAYICSAEADDFADTVQLWHRITEWKSLVANPIKNSLNQQLR